MCLILVMNPINSNFSDDHQYLIYYINTYIPQYLLSIKYSLHYVVYSNYYFATLHEYHSDSNLQYDLSATPQTNAPNIARIPKSEVVGVTVVLLTCYYRQQEFIRVGYYVNNEYSDPELKESPPNEPDFDKVSRRYCGITVY